MKKGLIFLMMIMCACSDEATQANKDESEAPDGASFSRSFVQTFMVPNTLSATMQADRYICLHLNGLKLARVPEHKTGGGYEALCKKHNDLSFNHKIVPNTTIALGRDHTSISVVCDKAIDENPPQALP